MVDPNDKSNEEMDLSQEKSRVGLGDVRIPSAYTVFAHRIIKYYYFLSRFMQKNMPNNFCNLIRKPLN